MFTYTNRRGFAYYVHEARTKAGAPRYVVKRTADGALANLPGGLEVAENVNGQVSVRAAQASGRVQRRVLRARRT